MSAEEGEYDELPEYKPMREQQEEKATEEPPIAKNEPEVVAQPATSVLWESNLITPPLLELCKLIFFSEIVHECINKNNAFYLKKQLWVH